jgi:hypothetical protein
MELRTDRCWSCHPPISVILASLFAFLYVPVVISWRFDWSVLQKRAGLIDWFWGHDGSLGDHSRGAGQAHAAVPEHHAGQRVSCSTTVVGSRVRFPKHCYESIVSNPDSLNSHAGLVLNPDLDPESRMSEYRSRPFVESGSDSDQGVLRPIIEGKKFCWIKEIFIRRCLSDLYEGFKNKTI